MPLRPTMARERPHGRPSCGDLLRELRRWLYDHRILISHDRLLKRLIVQAMHHLDERFARIRWFTPSARPPWTIGAGWQRPPTTIIRPDMLL